MAEVLGIVSSTISIVDLSVKLVTFLVQVKQGSDTIDNDLEGLIGEVNSLNAVSVLIRECFERDLPTDADAPGRDREASTKIWRAIAKALQDSQKTLDELDALIKKVRGDGGSSTVDKVRRYFRKLFKEEELVGLRQRLNNGHQLLQIFLTAIDMYVSVRCRFLMLTQLQRIHSQVSSHIEPVFRRVRLLNPRPRK